MGLPGLADWVITGRSLPEVSCPASLVSFLPPVLGWLAGGLWPGMTPAVV